MKNAIILFLSLTLLSSQVMAKGKKRKNRRRADDQTQLSQERIIEINNALLNQENINSINYVRDTQAIADLKRDLHILQKSISPKWEKLEKWQNNKEWTKNTIEMSLAGEIYNEGWFGPSVTRQIVPDLINGWLVIDTITIGPGILMTAGVLTGNILLNQVFPYVQAGPIKEKNFLNVKKVDTYAQAVLTKPFNLNQIPLSTDDFSELAPQEQISTISTGGAFIRAGGGISHLIGLELPAHINLGPKAKLTYKGSLKLTVAKEDEDHAIISVETASEHGKGLGFGFGIFFQDIIDIPVTIGVNSANGYFPFLFNVKNSRKTTKSIDYRINLKTQEGQLAYQAFLKRDFAFLEDMAVQYPEAVSMDMTKEGVVHTHEKNGMVNLIVWRSGYRNIFVEGSFNTTDRAGNRFEYFELEAEDIRDKKWFSNIEKTSLKFMALVPSDKHQNGELIKHKGGFVLDTHFFYSDSKTKGEEVVEISEYLMNSGTQMRLPVKVSNERNYGHVQIDLKVRIQAQDMARFLGASTEEHWAAIAYAQGINDYLDYQGKRNREDFIEYGQSGDRKERKKILSLAKQVIVNIEKIQDQPTLKDKAKLFINLMRKGSKGQLLHKTLLEFVGKRKALVRGFVRGKYL